MIAPLGIENRKVSVMATVWLVIIICSTLSYSLEDRTQYGSASVQNGNYVPPPPGGDWSTGAATRPGTKSEGSAQSVRSDIVVETYLVQEQAEQECDAVAQNIEAKTWPAFGSYSHSYDEEELACFGGGDPGYNLGGTLWTLLYFYALCPILDPRLFNLLSATNSNQLLCLHLVILSSFAFALLRRRTRS